MKSKLLVISYKAMICFKLTFLTFSGATLYLIPPFWPFTSSCNTRVTSTSRSEFAIPNTQNVFAPLPLLVPLYLSRMKMFHLNRLSFHHLLLNLCARFFSFYACVTISEYIKLTLHSTLQWGALTHHSKKFNHNN